ncbi:MAG: hypothetical protein H6502_00985 [Candidatus Woesearchaeota archaeon]|nr:MAG: hypothetical protein H6502_00985 [Candidatus Woesearchaeota archaeon]
MVLSQKILLGLIAVVSVTCVYLLIEIVFTPTLTAHVITAYGGEITQMNVHLDTVYQNDWWFAVYGNITNTTNSTNMTTNSASNVVGATLYVNWTAFFDNLTEDRYTNLNLFASTHENPDLTNLWPVHPAWADVLVYGFNWQDGRSNMGTFTTFHDFTINSQLRSLYSTRTNSVEGEYWVGIARDATNNKPVFVTEIVNGSGFDGSHADFQLILPVNSTNITYYFSFAKKIDALLNCTEDFELNASLLDDNQTVQLNWTNVTGATSYTLSVLTGNVTTAPDFRNATNNSLANPWFTYVDTGTETTFFQVTAHKGIQSCTYNNTLAGIYNINTYEGLNLVSVPVIPVDPTIEEVFKTIDELYVTINEYDNSIQDYHFYIRVGGFVFQDFYTINKDFGYWMLTENADGVATVVGAVTQQKNEALLPGVSLVVFPTPPDENHTVENRFSSVFPNLSTINEYENSIHDYHFYILVSGFVFQDFYNAIPTRGYWTVLTGADTMVIS